MNMVIMAICTDTGDAKTGDIKKLKTKHGRSSRNYV